MFATLYLERDPLKLADMPGGMVSWVQDAGGFCLVLLLAMMIWARARWPGGLSAWLWGAPDAESSRRWASSLFQFSLIGAVLGYAGAGVLRLLDLMASPSTPEGAEVGKLATSTPPVSDWVRASGWALTFAAACALVAVLLPFLVSLLSLRWRRIWGIARLSFKEAVRRKVLYVFASFLLILLFLGWFVPAKRESQLQTYVTVIFLCLTPILLVSSALLAAFGIPTDIKQQTIHTVVTKPVERFELVLGRFLGYTLLMSSVLLVLTPLSLFYVRRGINPDAAAESLKARDPLYGKLTFQRINEAYTVSEFTSLVDREDHILNVGREWDYHKYIPGVNLEKETGPILQAVWDFDEVPAVLGRRPRVRCEYKFDIYRQSKGKEGEAVRCSFFFHTRYFDPVSNDRTNYYNARNTLRDLQRPGDTRQREAQQEKVRKALPGASDDVVGRLSDGMGKPDEIDDLLAEQYGYHEVQAAKVVDYHTLFVDLPGGLFRNARNGPPGGGTPARAGAPLLTTRVRCESSSQFIGMARYDIYFRQDDPGEEDSHWWAFAWNFCKGTLGLWMVMCLVIGLCVCLSTELSGIIAFLCVMFLYLGGWARSFIQELAEKKNPYGGPLEASYRLFSRKSLALPVDDTTLGKIATGSDDVFRGFARVFIKVLPDVERYSFTDQVANGFNIGLIGQDLLPTLLLLLGYLLPWALLAFYWIKSREIAGAH
jgi:hypothetical protein